MPHARLMHYRARCPPQTASAVFLSRRAALVNKPFGNKPRFRLCGAFPTVGAAAGPAARRDRGFISRHWQAACREVMLASSEPDTFQVKQELQRQRSDLRVLPAGRAVRFDAVEGE